MVNGSTLAEYKRKLDNGDTIPQNVTNGIILTAVIELYGKFGELEKGIDCLTKNFEKEEVLDKTKEERLVTWPYLWENFGKTIVSLIIAIVISYFFFRAGIIK